jgi:hypothetical protein
MNCMLCHREESTTAPNGMTKYPARSNYTNPKKKTSNLICSKCIVGLLAGRATQMPWDGKIVWQDDYKGMRRTKTKLTRRTA